LFPALILQATILSLFQKYRKALLLARPPFEKYPDKQEVNPVAAMSKAENTDVFLFIS
jgi:hypothetical protein